MLTHSWLKCTAVVALLTSAVAVAAPDDVTFVYRGRLERNGEPVVTPVALRFGIYSGGTRVGSEFTYASVPVSGGEFSVEIGPLTAAQLAVREPFLEVTVNGVVMPTRQRLRSVPTAMRGRGDGAFVVDDALTVNGPANITSGVTSGPVNGVTLGEIGHPGWLGVMNGNLAGPNRFALLQSNNGATTLVNAANANGNVAINVANVGVANFTAGGRETLGNEPVPTATQHVRIVRAIVGGSGNIISGGGFSVSRANTGVYDLTFNPGFTDKPAISCTNLHPNPGAQGSGYAHCLPSHPDNISNNSFRIIITDGNGTNRDWPFSIIVIGAR
jgi:hypothetical protein